jgi:NitT/TauT family transport system permease protein
MSTATRPKAPERPRRVSPRGSVLLPVSRWLIVAGVVALLELAARVGAIDPLIMPPPSAMVRELVVVLQTAQFWDDATTSGVSLLASFGIGTVGGLLVGVIFWKLPFVGATFEPYLVSLYAAPTVVFYPILLAVLGLGPGPIILIASTMAMIPVALNTMVGLKSIPPSLPKLARSMNLGVGQTFRKVLLPAATPLLVPGLVLGCIYATIGVIAMEFILASNGLGFRIGYAYRSFDIERMYAYIVVVVVVAAAVNVALNRIERRVRRDME